MRPKKTLLCVDASELGLSVHALVLETWGYRVVKAESAQRAVTALRQMPSGSLDLVVLYVPLVNALSVMRSAKARHPEVRTLVLNTSVQHDVSLEVADVYLTQGVASEPMQVRERIRVLLARKRGPKALQAAGEKKPVLNATALIAQQRAREKVGA